MVSTFCLLLHVFCLFASLHFLFAHLLGTGRFFRPGKFYPFDIGVGPGFTGWFGLGFWKKNWELVGGGTGLVSVLLHKERGKDEK